MALSKPVEHRWQTKAPKPNLALHLFYPAQHLVYLVAAPSSRLTIKE